MKSMALFVTLAGCSVAAGNGSAPDAGPPHADVSPAGDAAPAPPAQDDVADGRALVALVDDYAARGLFMGTALVHRRGVTLLDVARGFANAEWEVANTRDTRFRIGSITKTFTATAILLLEEDGKLKAGDRLSAHLPDVPPAWSEITLHHLLSHAAGIPNLTDRPDYPMRRTQPSTPELNYRFLRELPLDFPPGSRFQYSNSNYLVLAYLIEKLTGKGFDAFVTERVLTPVGLRDTGPDGHRPLIKRRADGYVPLMPVMGVAPPTPYRNSDFIDMSMPGGAGSFLSTTGDLLRFMQALLAGRVVSPASLARMTTPGPGDYGYGLFIGTHNGSRRIGHGGSVHGFLSTCTHFPDHDITLVLLANLTAGQALSELAEKLIARAIGAPVNDAGAGSADATD